MCLQPKRKDNMSKEMKAKLRQEYIGLGGSENKVSLEQFNHHFSIISHVWRSQAMW